MTVTNLTAGGSNTGATSYATASITPGTNDLILAAVQTRTGITANPTQPTASGCGLTWVVIASVVYDDTSSSRKRLTLFRALGTPSSGAITFDEAGQSQTHASWVVDQVTGMDTSGTNGSGAIVQSATNFNDTGANTGKTLTVTLGAFGSGSNITYGVFADDGSGMTVGSGFTQAGSGTSAGGNTMSEYELSNNTSVLINDAATTSELGGIAIEIKAASVVTPTNGLWLGFNF